MKPTRKAPTQRYRHMCCTHTYVLYTPSAFREGDYGDAQTRIFSENGEEFPNGVLDPLDLV